MLLMLFGLTRVSPHRRRVHAARGGRHATAESACAMHSPVSISHGTDRRVGPARLEGHRSTSTAIIEAIRPEVRGGRLFPKDGLHSRAHLRHGFSPGK